MLLRSLLVGAFLLAAVDAGAAETRYALLVGANVGAASDAPLRFAVTDARRTGDVLRALGGFLPENIVILESPPADRVRDALARLNARIRAESDGPADSLLIVFYSGHADAVSLHLGGTSLPWEELRNLTAGSSARARLLVVDACRSGEATRVKGTTLVEPFALPAVETPVPEGFAVLSSAAAGESAQESDELESSFFTHHFLAALHGVADSNGDGKVTLSEAYQYASDQTVGSTASTLSGVQHPTYLYDIKGRTELVLTTPGENRGLARLQLSAPGQYLVRTDGPQGDLVLEASIGRAGRAVWLRPGRYLVQRRMTECLYEGYAMLEAGQTRDAGGLEMRIIEYAQLTRKGGGGRAYSVSAWGGLGAPILEGFSPPWVGRLSLALDTEDLTLDAAVSFSRSGHASEHLRSTLSGFSLSGGGRRVFDIRALALSAGLRLGVIYYDERYTGSRIAPPRHGWTPLLDVVGRADIEISWGLFLGLEGIARTSALREKTGLFVEDSRAVVHGIGLVGVGRHW